MLFLIVLGMTTEYSSALKQPPQCMSSGRSIFTDNLVQNTACIIGISLVLLTLLLMSCTFDYVTYWFNHSHQATRPCACFLLTMGLFLYNQEMDKKVMPMFCREELDLKTHTIPCKYLEQPLFNCLMYHKKYIVLQYGSCCTVSFAALIHVITSVLVSWKRLLPRNSRSALHTGHFILLIPSTLTTWPQLNHEK